MRTAKFQADLAPSDFAVLQTLMNQMEVRSKADFLSTAIYFMQWAVAERKKGYRIATVSPDGSRVKEVVMPELERVAPQIDLSFSQLDWTKEELDNFKRLTAEQQPEPTEHLVRAMKTR